MYQATTRAIRVTVEPRYLAEESTPEEGRFFWAYTIRIDNDGAEAVQLRARHWRITDALGRTQEVRGLGVVGEQPVIPPGASFSYTSGAPLSTPTGFMVGTYLMVSAQGEEFVVDIPAFSLDSPHARATVN